MKDQEKCKTCVFEELCLPLKLPHCQGTDYVLNRAKKKGVKKCN